MCDNVWRRDPRYPGAWVSAVGGSSGGVATEAVRDEQDGGGGDQAAASVSTLQRLWARREWILVVLGGLGLAALLTWPTLRDPTRTVPGDIGDPALFAWQIAWGGHALLHNPLHLWDSNTFFPDPHSLAFTDTVIGYAPFGVFGSGMETAVLRYNILYVLLHALA